MADARRRKLRFELFTLRGKSKCAPLRLLFPQKYFVFLWEPIILSPLLCKSNIAGHQTNFIACRCGGIGRRKGLKILCVRVTTEYMQILCEYGEIGRRKRLKIFRERSHIGSNPITRTRKMGENQAIFPHFLRLGTDWEPKMRLSWAFLYKYTPRKLSTYIIWNLSYLE